MPRYALVDDANQFVWPEKFRYFDSQPSDPAGKPWHFLPAPEGVVPAIDAAVQTVDPPTYIVSPTQVTETYTARDLTPAELDAAKEGNLNTVNLVTFRALFNHENRIRALESKAPITAAQFRTALKQLL